MVSETKALTRVSVGLGLMLAATVLLATAMLLLFVLPQLAVLYRLPIAFLLGLSFVLPIVVTSNAIDMIGQSLCLSLPREARATHFILFTLACVVCNTALEIVGNFVELPRWFGPISGVLILARPILLLLWVRRTGLWLKRQDLISVSTSGLRLIAVLCLYIPVALFVLFISLLQHPFLAILEPFFDWVGKLIVYPGFILILIIFLRYLRCLVFCRRAILEYSRQSSEVKSNTSEIESQITS